jgi:alpha-beta hydrolase superfamily lysophospholipase
MRSFGKWLGRFILFVAAALVVLFLFGPYEEVDLTERFDPSAFEGDPAAYFARTEAEVPGLRPGEEKRVIWAGEAGARTDVVLVYLHGFSASTEEIRPVPARVAAGLGANLVYARLKGHSRDGAAMAEPDAGDWMRDTSEALEAAKLLGDRIVVLSTSTGGTLAAAAAMAPDLSEGVEAMIFVSPNFGVNSPLAPLLTWPAARYWLPLIAGETRSFEPHNELQGKHWTTRYPTIAVLPMAALVQTVRNMEFASATVPALFWIADEDQVVRPDLTRAVAAKWGGPAKIHKVTPGPDDDPSAHLVTGDIMSPAQTEPAIEGMLTWLREQGL